MKKINKFNLKGFTLIELLAIVSILAIILIIAIPIISNIIEDSKKNAFKNEILVILKQADFEVENYMLTFESKTITETDTIYSGNIRDLNFSNSDKWSGSWKYEKSTGIITLYDASNGKYITTVNSKTPYDEIVVYEDNIPLPTITLNGNDVLTIVKNEEYIELGATAIDAYGNNIEVLIDSNVDTSVLGEYEVVYSTATGKYASITRKVIVIDMENLIIDTSDYETIIYVDESTGDDSTGNGSASNPFKTLGPAITNAYNNTAIIMGKGNYDSVNLNNYPNEYEKLAFIGQGVDTKFNITNTITITSTVDSGVNITTDLYFYNLVWDGNSKGTTRFIMFKNSGVFFNNVAFINIANDTIGYFTLTNKAFMEFHNCTKANYSTKFLRDTGDYIKVYNSYGAFTAGYGTTTADFDTGTNIITDTPNLDHLFVIYDENWKNIGTGLDRDGTQADIGVYGGQFAWLKPVIDYDSVDFSSKDNIDLTSYETIIYVDESTGNNTSGDGSISNPFRTIDIAIANAYNNTAIIMGKGNYDSVNLNNYPNEYEKLAFIGQGVDTKFIIKGTLTASGASSSSVKLGTNLYFYDLVWDGNSKGTTNFIMLTKSGIIFNNIAFINTGNSTYGYFTLVKDSFIEIYNSVKNNNSSDFLRATGNYIKVYNSYGGFTAGYETTTDKFNTATNIFTSTPNLDNKYNILDSGWKDSGTGLDKDQTQADIGVYGGQYSW